MHIAALVAALMMRIPNFRHIRRSNTMRLQILSSAA